MKHYVVSVMIIFILLIFQHRIKRVFDREVDMVKYIGKHFKISYWKYTLRQMRIGIVFQLDSFVIMLGLWGFVIEWY